MVYYFDDFELNVERATLTKDGALVKVEPQVFTILALLVEKHEEIVSRDLLIDAVWQGRNVSNNLIDSRIRSTRQAIGDDGKAQRLIKTFTHQGFRFVGAVTRGGTHGEPLARPGEKDEKIVAEQVASMSTPTPARRRIPVAIAAMIGLGTLLTALYVVNFNTQFDDGEIGPEEIADGGRLPTIAVLPAIGEIKDPKADSFSMAVAEEMISFLGGIRNLNVVSRTSSFAFRDQRLSPQEINDALGVDYRIESRCRLIDDRVVVTVQLVRVDGELIIWSKRYEVPGALDGLNERQVTIARNVAQNTTNTLGLSASDFSPNVISAGARATFTDGLAHLDQESSEGVEAAIAAFRSVIFEEPDYIPAYARLFDAYWAGIMYGGMTFDAAVPEMRKVERQMKVLGPQTPEALTAEAILLQIDDDSSQLSEKLFDILARARAAGPNYALAFQETAHALSHMDRYGEAAAAFEDALVLDPVSPELLAGASWALFNADEFEKAYATANKNIRWNPESTHSKIAYARLLISSNRQIEAYRVLVDAITEQPDSYAANYNLSWLLVHFGAYSEAMKHSPLNAFKAYIAALDGDTKAARNYAELMPNFYRSKRALYIIDDAKPAYDHLLNDRQQKEASLEANDLSHRAFSNELIEVHIYRLFDDPNAGILLENARDYIEKHPLKDFQTVQQYYGALSYYVITENFDAASTVLSAANENGFVFLHIFQLPLIKPFRDHPMLSKHIDTMELNAAEMLEKMQSGDQDNS